MSLIQTPAVRYQVSYLSLSPDVILNLTGEALLRKIMVGAINQGHEELPWSHIICRESSYRWGTIEGTEMNDRCHILIVYPHDKPPPSQVVDLFVKVMCEQRRKLGFISADNFVVDERVLWLKKKKTPLLMRLNMDYLLETMKVGA
jgi:hypothetical protein